MEQVAWTPELAERVFLGLLLQLSAAVGHQETLDALERAKARLEPPPDDFALDHGAF